MQIILESTSPQNEQKSCLVIGIYEDGELTPTANSIDKWSHGYISKLLKESRFQGKIGSILPLLHLPNTTISPVLLFVFLL